MRGWFVGVSPWITFLSLYRAFYNDNFFYQKCTFYSKYKILKFTLKHVLQSLLHILVHADHHQGVYIDCKEVF
jgi:hypothetical protein